MRTCLDFRVAALQTVLLDALMCLNIYYEHGKSKYPIILPISTSKISRFTRASQPPIFLGQSRGSCYFKISSGLGVNVKC